MRGVISLTLDQQRGEVIITSKKKRDAILPKLKAAIESAGAELGVQKAPAAAPATTISTANADADADDDGDYLDDDAYFTSREGVQASLALPRPSPCSSEKEAGGAAQQAR